MHPLEAKIRSIRRRVQCWLLVEGAARLAAWVVGGAVVLGAADYGFRFQDLGLRVLACGGFFTLVGWAGYQFVVEAGWRNFSELALALRLERCFPALADRLASSVAFLQQTQQDPTEGSSALRALTIEQAAQQAASIDFREALDVRPVVRSVLVASAILAAAAALVWSAPDSAQIAFIRLAAPFSDTSWPQRTHLILLDRVERIARGNPLELFVEEKNGNLPDDLRIHYRLEMPEGIQEQTEAVPRITQRTETGQWKELGHVRREGLFRPFWYRVTGGDDTAMDWIRVEILEPPSLLHCQVRLIPPEYTGLPPETAGQWIRALIGSRVEITGSANRRLRAATLLADEDQHYPAQILPDGRSFQIGAVSSVGGSGGGPPAEAAGKTSIGPSTAGNHSPSVSKRMHQKETSSGQTEDAGESPRVLCIRQSGRWRLRLIDEDGLEHEAASWEVRAVPDLPPSLMVESPPVLTYATPGAVVPLRVKVKDDLGIQRVDLLAMLTDQAASGSAESFLPPKTPGGGNSEETLPLGVRHWTLYEGPMPPPRQSKSFSAGDDLSPPLPVVEYAWDLSRWQTHAGMQIVFYVQAADYAGQTAPSQAHRILLLTPQQFLERALAQQNALLAELGQWLQKQRSLRDQLAQLHQSLADGKVLSQREIDRLRSLELLQRQIHSQLAYSPESLLVRLENLLADLENNHLGQTDFQPRWEYLRSGLRELEQEHLGPIDQKLIHGIKTAQAALELQPSAKTIPPPAIVLESVGQVLGHQEQVIRSLEAWLDRFRPGLQTQRFSQQLDHLLRDQQNLLEQVRRTAQSTLSKELRELGPQELADLESAAQRQAELARRMETLQQEMADALRELQAQDSPTAQILGEAVRYAQQTGLAAAMHTTSQDILQNRMGRLFQSLPQILSDLQRLSDLLANRQGQTLSRTMPLLDQIDQTLAELVAKQQHIQTLLESVGRQKPTDQPALLQQAAAHQETLTPQVQKIQEQVEHLWAAASAQAIRSALEAMQQSAQSARKGQLPQAIHASQAALQTLQQARQLLALQRFQIQAALLGQQLARLREALPGLQQRQEEIWKETVQLEDIQKNKGTLDHQQQLRLADLARRQQELYVQTQSWMEKLTDASVVQMALEETARWMQRAAQQLAQNQSGSAAQQAQQEALAQLRLLLESLGQDAAPIPLPKQTASTGPQPPNSSEPRKVVSAAELRLLRLWQQSVHERTLAFHQTFGDHPPDQPEVRSQYEALRQTQARLAHMIEQILRPPSAQEAKP